MVAFIVYITFASPPPPCSKHRALYIIKGVQSTVKIGGFRILPFMYLTDRQTDGQIIQRIDAH